MDTKTEAQMEEAAVAFVELVKENLPENMRKEHMIATICGILTSFYDTPRDAYIVLAVAASALADYYLDNFDMDTECDCPNCVAERKANAH